MTEQAENADVKTRAVRAAARAIGIGEHWITKEYYARVFAAHIIAAIEAEGITLVDSADEPRHAHNGGSEMNDNGVTIA
jgi:hypothetical protein